MSETCLIQMKNFLDQTETGVIIANGAIDMLLKNDKESEDKLTTCLPDCAAKKLFPIFVELGMTELVSNDEEANIQVYKVVSTEGLKQIKERMANEYVKEK